MLSEVGNGLMKGCCGFIMGFVNDKLIVWGIVKVLVDQGVEFVFLYQGEVLKCWVELLVVQLGFDLIVECDVLNEVFIDGLFDVICQCWDSIDFIVYVIGFFDKDQLCGCYVDIMCDNFMMMMDIFVYFFIVVVCCVVVMMNFGGLMLMLIYYGVECVMLYYNVMGVVKVVFEVLVCYLVEDLGKDGICVNVISVGLIKMLVVLGIGDLCYILKWNELNLFLCCNVSQDEVGKLVLYLLFDLGLGVIGEMYYVDLGYYIVGMKVVDVFDIVMMKKD